MRIEEKAYHFDIRIDQTNCLDSAKFVKLENDVNESILPGSRKVQGQLNGLFKGLFYKRLELQISRSHLWSLLIVSLINLLWYSFYIKNLDLILESSSRPLSFFCQ